jgi:hypothetical protein
VQAVAVDQLFDAALTGRAEYPDRRRRVGGERADRVQQVVEVAAGGFAAAETLDDLQQLETVTDGDVGDRAALGGHDDRDPT